MNKIILLLSLIVFSALMIENSLGALRTQYLYQGTGCPGDYFMKSIRNNAAGCNVTNCIPYGAEPTVLSVKYDCPTDYPTNPVLNSGEIQVFTFTDIDTCNSTTLSRFDTYKTNVCMKSSIIFGPGTNSGKYIGCGKVVLYSDGNCTTETSSTDITLNTCDGGKVYKCITPANSIKNSGSSSILSAVVIFVLAVIVAAL